MRQKKTKKDKIRKRQEDIYEKYLQEKGTPVAARSPVPDRFIIYTAEGTGSGSGKTFAGKESHSEAYRKKNGKAYLEKSSTCEEISGILFSEWWQV